MGLALISVNSADLQKQHKYETSTPGICQFWVRLVLKVVLLICKSTSSQAYIATVHIKSGIFRIYYRVLFWEVAFDFFTFILCLSLTFSYEFKALKNSALTILNFCFEKLRCSQLE